MENIIKKQEKTQLMDFSEETKKIAFKKVGKKGCCLASPKTKEFNKLVNKQHTACCLRPDCDNPSFNMFNRYFKIFIVLLLALCSGADKNEKMTNYMKRTGAKFLQVCAEDLLKKST